MKMKKLLTSVLAVAMVASLAACGSSASTETTVQATETAAESTAAETAAAETDEAASTEAESTDAAAFQDVVNGKIFAAVGSTSVSVQQFLNQSPRNTLVAEDVALPQITILVSIAISWQNFHLRELINSYFDYLQKNGVLTSVFQKYGVTP